MSLFRAGLPVRFQAAADHLPGLFICFDKLKAFIVFFQTIENKSIKGSQTMETRPETITKEKQIEIYQEKIPAALYSFYADFLPENLKDNQTEIEKTINDSSQNRFSAALIFICPSTISLHKTSKSPASQLSLTDGLLVLSSVTIGLL